MKRIIVKVTQDIGKVLSRKMVKHLDSLRKGSMKAFNKTKGVGIKDN